MAFSLLIVAGSYEGGQLGIIAVTGLNADD
jgi:hypothetical protein